MPGKDEMDPGVEADAFVDSISADIAAALTDADKYSAWTDYESGLDKDSGAFGPVALRAPQPVAK